MAPCEDKDTARQPRPSRPADENPFLALQRFAEEQMSAMLQSLVGLPSAITAHSPTSWPPADDHPLPDHYRRRIVDTCQQAAGHATPSPHPDPDPETADRLPPYPQRFPLAASPFSPLWLARYLKHSPYAPPALEADPLLSIRGPRWRHAFEDLLAAESGRPMGDYEGCDADARAPTRRACRDRYVARWDRLWDQNTAPRRWGPFRWRRYVEPTPDTNDAMEAQSASEGRVEAPGERDTAAEVRGAVDEATELMRQVQRLIFESVGFEEEEGEEPSQNREHRKGIAQLETELDAYERMLGGDMAAADEHTTPTSTSTSTAVASSFSSHPPQNEDGRPSVVATMTSTQRVILPDGTVRTKRVLKRRFADGREDEDESESVSPSGRDEGPDRHTLGLREDERKNRGILEALKREGMAPTNEKHEGKRNKSGWFWS